MAGLWNRIKVWIADETLTSAAQNAEFDNVRANAIATMTEGYSTVNNVPNNAAMDSTTAPFPNSARSYATSVAGELQRLRYQINQMISGGSGNWYDQPASSISQLQSLIQAVQSVPNQRVLTGRTRGTLAAGFVSNQPIFLVPSGSTNSVTLKATATPLTCVIDGTNVTVSADITATGLTLAPSSNNTALVDAAGLTNTSIDTDLFPRAKIYGEGRTPFTIKSVGSNISALSGNPAAFKVVNGGNTEYFFGNVDSATQLTQCLRGYFFDSADAPIPRIGIADGDTVTLMKLTWVFLTNSGGTPALAVSYDTPIVSYNQPTSPAVNQYWYDMSTSKWKVYSSGAGFQDAVAVLLGICCQDTTKTAAARSFDFFHVPQAINTVAVEYRSSTIVKASRPARICVNGVLLNFQKYLPEWNMSTDAEPGASFTANVFGYLYITDQGRTVISDKFPHDRLGDKMGLYHPSNPWRFVSTFRAGGASTYSGQLVDYVTENYIAAYPTFGSFSCSAISGGGTITGSMRVFLTGKPCLVQLVATTMKLTSAAAGVVNGYITASFQADGAALSSTSCLVAAASAVASAGSQDISLYGYAQPIYTGVGWHTVTLSFPVGTNCTATITGGVLSVIAVNI